MSKQANPTLIGAFVLGAIILATIVILLLAEGNWFQERREHVMYFREVGQGLQVGAPVVFLGVKIGNVKQIQLAIDNTNHRIIVPVTIELEPHIVRTSSGEEINLQERLTIRDLINRGLRARLKTQSLLTGQLYVDLDFYPDKPAHFFSEDPKASEIPTIPTTIHELTTMLENFPMDSFLADLSAISSAINKILSSESTRNIPLRLEATLTHLESITAELDAEDEPLLVEVKSNLLDLHKSITAVKSAMGKVGRAADRVNELAEPDSEMYSNISRAGDELSNAAQALQDLANEQSPTIERLNLSLQEITRAARALRLLAETLEKQPEALLRGKRIREEN